MQDEGPDPSLVQVGALRMEDREKERERERKRERERERGREREMTKCESVYPLHLGLTVKGYQRI